MTWYGDPDSGGFQPPHPAAFTAAAPNDPLMAAFEDLARRLRVRFPFDRTVLLLKKEDTQQLLAVAAATGGTSRKLRLSLPLENSLLAKVIEHGLPYCESYCGFFSGNQLEQRLLFDDTAAAFALLPLKRDGAIVGVLGFSSDDPDAFRLFEDTDWAPLTQSLTATLDENR